jgi:hypothetical protein
VERRGVRVFTVLILEDYDEGNALADHDPDILTTRQVKSGRPDGHQDDAILSIGWADRARGSLELDIHVRITIPTGIVDAI